jgi:hypothetical protein
MPVNDYVVLSGMQEEPDFVRMILSVLKTDLSCPVGRFIFTQYDLKREATFLH